MIRGGSNFIDRTGMKYGRFTVLARSDDIEFFSKGKVKRQTRWLCKCDCGKEKVIRSSSLVTRDTVSCGCYAKETRIAQAKYLSEKYGSENGKKRGPVLGKLYGSWLGKIWGPINIHFLIAGRRKQIAKT